VIDPAEITRHHEFGRDEGEFVGGEDRSDADPVVIVEYDPAWPDLYEAVARRIRAAVGDRVLALDHVGSTAVPGLAAKAVIDVDLTVADSTDEEAYVGDLERAGFRLRLREPAWHEHRLFRGVDPTVNLHVFSPDCPETVRHLLFRDWLRTHPDDAARYAEAKRASASANTAAGGDGMDYNQLKQAVIRDIYADVFRAHGLITP
jgi:GrpB-like predicted nucleotidyltransferase (UPF0157 family)